MARRTAISLRRPEARASIRLAILAHAMRSTRPDTTNSISSGGAIPAPNIGNPCCCRRRLQLARAIVGLLRRLPVWRSRRVKRCGRKHFQSRAHLLWRVFRFTAAHDAKPPRRAHIEHGERGVKHRLSADREGDAVRGAHVGASKAASRDADDFKGMTVECDGLPTAEGSPPYCCCQKL